MVAAGGSGTRLRPLTFSSNKHLLPIANKPLILYPIEAIAATGIREVGVVVNETRTAVEGLLGQGKHWGLNVTYINQEKPLGLAHVVKIAQEFLGEEPFVYHLGDNIFAQGIKKPVDKFRELKPDALLTLVTHKENYRLGVPFFDDTGRLVEVVEKPEKPPNQYGIPGLYMFNKHVFEAFSGPDAIQPSPRGELEITALYTYLLKHGYRVETEEVEGRWMDPGKFTDMLDANAHMLALTPQSQIEGEVDQATQIQGKVTIAKGARVRRCQIFGPAAIGPETIVEDSVVGPDVSIDTHCKLEAVTIKNSIVMQDSTLLNINRVIVDSMVGKNTEIWEEKQETVSLFIGDHCKVRLT